MAEFHISDSKIEQLSSSGANVKLSEVSGTVNLLGERAAHIVGDENALEQSSAPKSFWTKCLKPLFRFISARWQKN